MSSIGLLKAVYGDNDIRTKFLYPINTHIRHRIVKMWVNGFYE